MNKGRPSVDTQWIFDNPVHSAVEAKLRNLLIELGNAEKILGIQVCAYKDGKVIIDTAAGTLGRYDPRPVQPDSLFPVLSVTKGITAGMLHWLVDNGKVRLDDDIASIWPEFGTNGKEKIKVHHVLNHTAGLHNAIVQHFMENRMLIVNWDECLKSIALAAPETEPGSQQLYHFISFGWLCGGIIEHASGKKFQDILEESFISPLNIEGELYIGVPPGVESRLASLTFDTEDLKKLSAIASRPDLPSTLQPQDLLQMMTTLPTLFNALDTRRATIPASNGHCSARALARYYAALVDTGTIPPPHSSISNPPLGSHPHIPKFPTLKKPEKRNINKLFKNPKIHDAFMGVGEYENLALPNEQFGLGFQRSHSIEGDLIGFGHSGTGGSIGYCDIKHKFAIAVTVNKLSLGTVTAKIIHLVSSELGIPVPKELLGITEASSSNNISRL